MHLNELARCMRIVGDEKRLRIICLLIKEKQICVSEIASALKMSVAIVSHHLQTMAKEGIVIALRDKKRVCYKLSKTDFIQSLKKFIRAHILL